MNGSYPGGSCCRRRASKSAWSSALAYVQPWSEWCNNPCPRQSRRVPPSQLYNTFRPANCTQISKLQAVFLKRDLLRDQIRVNTGTAIPLLALGE